LLDAISWNGHESPPPGESSAKSAPCAALGAGGDIAGISQGAAGIALAGVPSGRTVSAEGPAQSMGEAAKTGPHGRQSELVERSLLVAVNLENLIEPRDAENFEKIGMNAAELQLAFDGARFALEVDELAERGAREVLDVPEVEQEIPVTFILDEAVELVADLLDVFFGDDL
jgi:hypothetical protein